MVDIAHDDLKDDDHDLHDDDDATYRAFEVNDPTLHGTYEILLFEDMRLNEVNKADNGGSGVNNEYGSNGFNANGGRGGK